MEFSGINVTLSAPLRLDSSTFHQYEPKLKLSSTLTAVSEAECKTPEELLLSVKSATNQSWVDHNFRQGSNEINKEEFDRILNENKDTI